MRRHTKGILLTVLVLICAVMVSACSTSSSKSLTFDVETGDKIKITIDTKEGYDLTMEVPFAVTKDGETVLNGSFAQIEAYDTYRQIIEGDANATLIDESSKDGNDYFCYTYEGAAGTECDYLMKVGGSDTVIIMGSLAGEDEVRSAFEAMTISLE